MFTGAQVSSITGGRLNGSGTAEAFKINTDTRKISDGDLFIALCGEKFDGNDFILQAFEKGAAICVTNRETDVPEGKAEIIVKDTGKALLELAGNYRDRFDVHLVGVTGSVGKTTTKEMIACALEGGFKTLKTEGNFNNEIGMPHTLFRLDDTYGAAVIEMGMNHFGELSRLSKTAKPDIAVITNIGISHIENLGSRENILKAKLEILDGLKEGGTLILNGEDEFLRTVKSDKYKIVDYGLGDTYDICGEEISDNIVKICGETIKLSVEGRHNLLNACAAMAVATELGLPPAISAKSLENYRPDGIRQTTVVSPQGVTILCDWYNAAPQSVTAALGLLAKKDGRKIAVLGDMLELGHLSEQSHRDVGKAAAQNSIDYLFTYGEKSVAIIEGAAEAGLLNAIHFSDKQKLSDYLIKFLKPGDFVLIKGSRGMKMEDVYEQIMR
ncbi:MAG: UDP-N-acetylmuramoyl-tripeptide--D-alanyl-D-alanine ligase [Clostridia bacterium]|nr:UDP-N-acetylmuramoyl-tripeptide--D-alanyl-D-alanine ligase [Clostridia bacterium]MBQ9598356.1 UDP-N-acetylmuramoyl-tripeptide--D-alanyl-D-alanine ligase [Clostridia bacterium]